MAEHLVARPGPLSDFGIAARHRDAAGDRAGALGLYNRWALQLRAQHAYAACFQITQEGINRFQIGDEEPEKTAVAKLWLIVHDALTPLGEISEAEAALEAALELVDQGTSEEARFSRASALLRMGRALAQKGDVRQALSQLERALADFEAGNHLNDRAVTLGDVARLRAQAGDVAGALKLQLERLNTNRSLGDLDGIAAALFDLSHLELQQEKPAEALERLTESWEILRRIGRADGTALVGQLYGLLLAETDPARALEVLRTSREAFQLLGMETKANEVTVLIQELEQREQPPP